MGEIMITISENTKIDDIDRDWVPEKGSIKFLFKSDSSFQLFADAYAIAYLRELSDRGCRIDVLIPDTDRIKEFLLGDDDSVDHPVFSIFGLQLIFVSQNVAFQSDSSKNIRSELGGAIWKFLLKSNMSIGFGRRIQYISNHTDPVPRSFGVERKANRYASYQNFKADFSPRISGAWKDGDGISDDHVDKISGIAFHAAENSYDHARSSKGRKIRGYYGLSLERLFFESIDKVLERNSLPDIVKSYLSSNYARLNLGESGKMRAQVISVSDIGDGIQNTLQKEGAISGAEIIQAAFKDLTTSKLQRDDDERPGFGLGDIVGLSRDLGCLIYVQSGQCELFYDFSDEPRKMTEGQKRELSLVEYNKRKKVFGTSISIVWIVQSDKLQPSLFDGGI